MKEAIVASHRKAAQRTEGGHGRAVGGDPGGKLEHRLGR
jgi:hypothetical protein